MTAAEKAAIKRIQIEAAKELKRMEDEKKAAEVYTYLNRIY